MKFETKEIKSVDVTQEALNTFKVKRKYEDDSLALQTDLYQINMAETYWDDNIHNRKAVFEVFFRKHPFVQNGYTVFAGLERVIEYLKNFKFTESDINYLRNELGYKEDFLEFLKTVRFKGNIKSAVEGEIVYPNQPILRVETDLATAQLIETPILNILNFHPLIATKAARIKSQFMDDEFIDMTDLMEFGMRRAHEFDAALYGARAAYIGGFTGTSNVRAGKLFGIPVKGTHAHAMVQVYGDEYIAFKKFAQRHKNCIFLVDTYDTLNSGVPNAIRVAKELGEKINFIGIRLDSGNLAELSSKVRRMLDEAGFTKAKIFASNDLDEYEVNNLKRQGAKIDGWGIGTKLITAYDQPAFGAVYKIVALEDENGNMVDTIKLSEDPVKATTPGLKKILRITNQMERKMEMDLIALFDENVPKDFDNRGYMAKDLQKDIFRDGELVYNMPHIEEIRQYCLDNLRMLKNANEDMLNPNKYDVALTYRCNKNKQQVVRKALSRMSLV